MLDAWWPTVVAPVTHQAPRAAKRLKGIGPYGLTDMEIEVLDAYIDLASYKAVAAKTGRHESVVNKALASARRKMHAPHRIAMVVTWTLHKRDAQ